MTDHHRHHASNTIELDHVSEEPRYLPPDPAGDRARKTIDAPYHATRPAPGIGGFLLANAGGIVCLIMLVPWLFSSQPIAAWGICSGAWLLNRFGQVLTVKMVEGMPNVMAVGAAGFGMLVRVWIVALALFYIGMDLKIGTTTLGLNRRDLALPAMLAFIVVFTVDLIVRAGLEFHRFKTEPFEMADTSSSGEPPVSKGSQ